MAPDQADGPRHGAPPRSRRGLIGGLVAGAAVLAGAGVLVANGIIPILPQAGPAPAPGASSTSTGAASAAPSAAAPASVAPCADAASIATDPAYAAAFTQLAGAYGATKGACSPVAITPVASADVAADGLGAAKAWIPEDASWAARAKAAALNSAKQTQVASSPLVMVSGPEIKDALAGEPLAGDTLTNLITLTKSYKDYGHPEWGNLKLVLPDPATSAAGAAGFLGLTQQVGKGEAPPTDLGTATPNQMAIPSVQYRVAELTKGADAVPGKLGTTASDATGINPAGPRVGLTTEFAALSADPADKLWATPFAGGRLGVQIPVVNPGGDQAATDFATWLTSAAGQRALADLGLRTADEQPGAAALTAVGLPNEPAAVGANQAQALAGAAQLYQGLAQRMAILTVIDLSGSMGKEVAPKVRAIDLITQATIATDWSKWPPGFVTGFMTFHTDDNQKPFIETPLPLTDNRSKEWPQLAQGFLEAAKNIQVGDGTPLYQAILQAYQYSDSAKLEGVQKRVIVLTDGKNEHAEPLMSEADLLAKLPKAAQGKPQLILVALGPEADHAALERIAKATGQRSLWVQDIRTYPQMVQQIMWGS